MLSPGPHLPPHMPSGLLLSLAWDTGGEGGGGKGRIMGRGESGEGRRNREKEGGIEAALFYFNYQK